IITAFSTTVVIYQHVGANCGSFHHMISIEMQICSVILYNDTIKYKVIVKYGLLLTLYHIRLPNITVDSVILKKVV
ncbi:MAG: hypothetical protein ACYTX0_59395, partial [Nostoc sp.]